MDASVRISLTPRVPADRCTHQILEGLPFLAGSAQPNQHLPCTREDAEDCLSKIMEKHDRIASFSVFVDDLLPSLGLLSFIRDQNPRKEIRVYWVDQALEGDFYSTEDLLCARPSLGPDLESVFDVVSSLTLLKACPEGLHGTPQPPAGSPPTGTAHS